MTTVPTPAKPRPRPFRRRDALTARSLHFGPNMTPMVDVVMVILVFFMASAAFVGPEWFLQALIPQKAAAAPTKGAGEVQPPTTPALAPIRQEFIIDVDASGATIVTGPGLAAATIDAAIAALQALVADLPREQIAANVEVLLKPTAKVPYREVVRLQEQAQRLGISRLGIAVNPQPAPK